MTHKQWVSALKRSFALAERRPNAAVDLLDRLVRSIEASQRRRTGEWHVGQTLGVIGAMLSGSGQHRAACAAFARLAKHHELELVYNEHAFVSALASEALELLSDGHRARAAKVLARAKTRSESLRHPNGLLEQAQKTLAASAKKQAMRRRSRAAAHREAAMPLGRTVGSGSKGQ